jgi:CheY-like chemotaxis protein
MFNQIFVPFLVKENLLTAEQAKEVLEQQRHARVRMGVLAIEEKWMSLEDVEHVNRLQASKNARFGDIAIDRGYLTKVQVESLLTKQPREHVILKQIITDKGYIPPDKFDLTLGTFKTKLGVTYDEFEKLQDKNVDAFISIIGGLGSENMVLREYIKLFVNTTIRFIDREVRINEVYKANSPVFKHVVWQKSAGDGEYTFVLATDDTRAACMFGGLYSKFPIDDMDEDGQDSFKEFLNCVGGLLVADLSNKDLKELEIEPPEYNSDYNLGQEVTILPFSLPMGDFFLTVLEPSKVAPVTAKKFVLVDDSKIARHLLKTILEEAGHEVVAEATNGLDGYDMYRQHKPDFITLDVTMPILNGIECLKKIMKTDDDAKAIMVTSVGKEKLINEAMAIGAKAVLVKPIEKKDVLNVVNSLM